MNTGFSSDELFALSGKELVGASTTIKDELCADLHDEMAPGCRVVRGNALGGITEMAGGMIQPIMAVTITATRKESG